MCIKKSLNRIRPAELIVDHHLLIRRIVLVITLISALLIPFTEINYDLTTYLPADEPSKVAIDKMEEIFGYPGTARLVLRDVSLYEAKGIKDQVSGIKGVDQVIWCDTFTDLYKGSGFIDTDDVSDYYNAGNAVMDITFSGGNTSRLTYGAIDEIEALVGEKGSLSGMAPTHKFGQQNTTREMGLILLMSVIFIGIILFVMTDSYFEPVLFFAVLGSAVIINKGTNIFLGTVSFMTNSVCIILQLATSMDYAIFLLNSFERERALIAESASGGTVPAGSPDGSDGGTLAFIDRKALKTALGRTVTTVVASSLTTFFGFIALIFMKFEIGFDLGIVLAKSIISSLFVVIFLMPSLILSWSGLIDRFKHRSFVPDFSRLARITVRLGPAVLAVSAVLIIPIYVAQGLNNFVYGVDAMCIAPGNTLYEATEEADEMFGRSNLLIALFPDEGNAKEKALSGALEELPYVRSVLGLSDMMPEGIPESILPGSVTERFHKDGYARLLIYIATRPESETAYASAEEVEDLIAGYYGDDRIYITGNTPITMDMERVMSGDFILVNLLAMAAVFLVVSVSFKSLVVAVAAMIPIMLAIYSNMAVNYILGEDMIFIAYCVISCIQLGATIDYAISETANYRHIRITCPDKRKAAEMMSGISIVPILTSGLILTVCGYTIGFFSTMPTVRAVGHLVGRGAILSMFFVMFLMPTLLRLIDPYLTMSRGERLISKRRKAHTENAGAGTSDPAAGSGEIRDTEDPHEA